VGVGVGVGDWGLGIGVSVRRIGPIGTIGLKTISQTPTTNHGSLWKIQPTGYTFSSLSELPVLQGRRTLDVEIDISCKLSQIVTSISVEAASKTG
jgi:hypothetical protein